MRSVAALYRGSKESRARSLFKALSYRLAGSVLTGCLVFSFGGGHLTRSAEIGAADMVLKLALYFLHERIWSRVEFGCVSYPPGPAQACRPQDE